MFEVKLKMEDQLFEAIRWKALKAGISLEEYFNQMLTGNIVDQKVIVEIKPLRDQSNVQSESGIKPSNSYQPEERYRRSYYDSASMRLLDARTPAMRNSHEFGPE